MKTTFKFYGKEINVSGLKRECEVISEVFDKLSRIKSYQLSYSGIKKEGEEPKGMLAWVMCGTYPLRDEESFKTKIENLKESLPAVVTLDYVRTIKPEIDRIFNAHVFIEDSRITEEEAAEIAKQREENERKRQQAANELIKLIGLAGEGTVTRKENEMSLTIQAYFNDSNSMVDYFHPHHSLGSEYAVAVVPKGSRRESIVRDLINSIPELAKLEWEWNVQEHSMGHGTFMRSSEIGSVPYHAYDGRTEVGYWYEIHFSNSFTLPKSRLFSTIKQEATVLTGSALTGDKIATCKINKSKGGIEIYFNAKPSTVVLDDLKANGFRWSKFNKCWYKLDNAIARRIAAKYAEVPSEEVNHDAGLVNAQEDAAIENGNY